MVVKKYTIEQEKQLVEDFTNVCKKLATTKRTTERTDLNKLGKKIPYPKKMKEAEIQAILYSKIIDEGYNARLEVRGDNCSFDIVVFNINNLAKCIIEVKNYSESYNLAKFSDTKQYKKYTSYDIPLCLCSGIEQIDSTVSWVKKVMK